MQKPVLVALLTTVLILVFSSAGFAEEGKIAQLCKDTVAALQQTAAQPLAKLFSVQAGTFLALVDGKAVLTGRDELLGEEKWADKPLLSAEAKLGEIESSDRLYAVRVSSQITDGDRTFLLDGVAVGEGGGLKWGMLAVVPKPTDDTGGEEARKAILGIMSTWGQALAGGNPEPMLQTLSPDAMSFAVVGPDYGFYVFKDREDLKMTLDEAMAQGGLSVQFSQEPQVVVVGPVALLHGMWKLDVGGQAVELECWAHLVKVSDAWQVVGFFALPPKQ